MKLRLGPLISLLTNVNLGILSTRQFIYKTVFKIFFRTERGCLIKNDNKWLPIIIDVFLEPFIDDVWMK